ncbi:DNRLRE domain-containing protein [Coraliomargarita parva]|uniref:DNRLRE domain-containing protein n=1 Tax=Coraliomargarita parva TaxID=3014050 RepID=UPI0022B55934|nr:DNRLRE domain-containing protein [Coraliomargarita parva]
MKHLKNMKYLKVILVPIFGIILTSSAALQAQTLSITASGDSMIRSDLPDNNYGTGTNFNGYIGTTNGTSDLRQVFAFDLSGLAGLGPDIQIDSVTMTLTQRGPDAGSTAATVDLSLYALTVGFTEGGVTWNTSEGSTAWTGGGALGNELSTPITASTQGVRGTELTFASSSAFISEVSTVVGSGGVLYLDVLANVGDLSERALINTYFREVEVNGEYVEGYLPTLTIGYSIVPEPSTYALLLGVICLLAVQRKRALSSKSA